MPARNEGNLADDRDCDVTVIVTVTVTVTVTVILIMTETVTVTVTVTAHRGGPAASERSRGREKVRDGAAQRP